MLFDTDKLYESYLRTGSVHRAAVEHKTTGETVRKHLLRAGKPLNRTLWTESELDKLKAAYSCADGVDIAVLAKSIGRTYPSIALKASRIGLSCERGKQIRTETAKRNACIAQKEVSQRPSIKAARAKAASEAFRKNGHPRGFLGHHRTPENIAKMRDGSKKAWANPKHRVNTKEYRQAISDRSAKHMATRPAENAFSRAKYGRRADLGEIFFRSAWEANYARYLNFIIARGDGIVKWEYEADTFWFDAIKRGCRSYKPDFKVYFKSGKIEYHEVKGWMYPRAKTALKRMKKYHPSVCVVLIDQPVYKKIAAEFRKTIGGWE